MSQATAPTVDFSQIPGIKILGEVGRGSQSIVYRATRGEKLFAVKVPRDPTLVNDTLMRFRREAGVLARAHHMGLAEIVDIGDVQGHPYLVMEYVEGKTLASLLEDGPLNEEAAVTLAKTLSGALSVVHGYGLVHRDIKPQNILIDANKCAKLIDFGFAGAVDKDQDGGAVVGTFLYSPPEQTGVLKRPLDGRTDLYSLGVTLFECVTGTTPYRSSDPGELIRLHAVMAPPDVREFSPDVSPGLAAIINKLLAKDPDDRYQNAKGLLFDLERLSDINRAIARSEDFTLDPQNESIEIVGETPLVGRDTELAILRNRWNAVMRGSGTVILVEGEPGSGKTRLIRELISKCGTPGTAVLRGKCFQRGSQPMAPLREAIDNHLKYVRTLPMPQRRSIEDRIRFAAGEVAPLLKRFSPTLADVLKTTQETAEFTDAQDLFYYAVADFFLSYARVSGGACLFIDDIQWIDDATKQVLTRIADQLSESPLLIATAGRNNGENLSLLTKFVSDMGKTVSTRLRLMPLVEGAVAKLVSAHLGGAQVDQSFVQQILSRANGNPFAVGEYVRSMLDAGLLRPSWGMWLVDTGGLEKLSISTDVEELVVKRIEDLGEKTKEILRAAAVVGSRFRVETLPVVSGAKLLEVNAALAEASMLNLLERGEAGEYTFVHNRIKEALLASLSSHDLRVIHQKIAESMDVSGGEGSEFIYSLAQHYSLGQVERNPQRVFETNFAAGIKALDNYANEDAYVFLKQAHQFASAGRIQVDNSLEETLGNICVQTSRYSEAIGYLTGALEKSSDPSQKARIRGNIAKIHLANIEYQEAWEMVKLAFSDLGTRPPGNNALAWGTAIWDWIFGMLADRFRSRAKPLGETEFNRHNVLAQLYELVAIISYFECNFSLVVQAVFRVIRIIQRLGPGKPFIAGNMLYAVCAGYLGWGRVSDRFSKKATQTAQSSGDPVQMGHVAAYNSVRSALLGRRKEYEGMIQVLEDYSPTLPFDDMMAISSLLVWSFLVRGYTSDAQKWLKDAKKKIEAFGAQIGDGRRHLGAWMYSYGVGSAALQGNRAECIENLKEFDALSVTQKYYLAIHYGNLLLFHIEYGELGEPLENAIQAFHALRIPVSGGPLTIRHFYVFQAYARLAQCSEASPKNRPEALRKLKQAAQQLQRVAGTPVLKAHAILMKSAVMRYEGNYRAALDYLSMAENIAREIDCPLALFEASKLRATLLLAAGNSASASREARVAHALAQELGWSHRARSIRNEFAIEETTNQSKHKSTISKGSKRSSSASNLNLQRQLDALMQLSLASGSILNADRQARVALDEIVRLLGAERAFIFLTQDNSNDLLMKAGRDSQGADIKELKGYSTTIVEEVRASKKALVVSGTDEGAVKASQSAVAYNLRSIMAAPMMIGDRLVGVVYLDSRLAKGIFTEDDVDILLALGNHIAIAQETARSAQVEMERKALEKDLELAGAVQNLLLPKEATYLSDRIKVAAYYKTATLSGGDWWWFDHGGGDRAVALVGDVTGHGAGSAMMTSAISSSYRTMSILGKVQEIPKVFEILNTNLLNIGSDTYSMTMSAIEINFQKSELIFWNAGAPPIFILKPDGSVETVVERSTPLGTEDFQMASRVIPVQRGSRIFIFTDGVYEFTHEGKQYGRKKLQALFVETKSLSIEAARDKIAAHVNGLIGKGTLEDDMTFVLLDHV